MQSMRNLFSLPLENKLEIEMTDSYRNRGYIGMGSESGDGGKTELKEGFSYGFDWEYGRKLDGELEVRNLWPGSCNGFSRRDRENLENHFKMMNEITKELEIAFALAFGLELGSFKGVCKDGDEISIMRCFHYFPKRATNNDGQNGLHGDSRTIGSSPHTDWGFCTIITQSFDSESALQFYTDQGQIIDIAPKRNCLVVNCGDSLSILTKGLFKSPKHQVVLTAKERYSFVYFAYPNKNACLPRMEEIPRELRCGKNRLSLFVNQSEEANGDVNGHSKVDGKDKGGWTFGECVMQKWRQVSRGND